MGAAAAAGVAPAAPAAHSQCWEPALASYHCAHLVPQPTRLAAAAPCPLRPPPRSSLRTMLFVSDLVSQFSKSLGCRALPYDAFDRALAGG